MDLSERDFFPPKSGEPEKLNDPWGKPFGYESDGRTYSYDPIIRFSDDLSVSGQSLPKEQLQAAILDKVQEQVNNPQSYNI